MDALGVTELLSRSNYTQQFYPIRNKPPISQSVTSGYEFGILTIGGYPDSTIYTGWTGGLKPTDPGLFYEAKQIVLFSGDNFMHLGMFWMLNASVLMINAVNGFGDGLYLWSTLRLFYKA